MLFSMATLVNVLCAVLAVCGAFVDFVPEEGNCCDSDCESCIDLNCSGDLCSSLTADYDTCCKIAHNDYTGVYTNEHGGGVTMLERPFSDIETITKGAVPDLPNPNSAMSFCCEAGCVECVCFVCNEKAQICFGTIPWSSCCVLEIRGNTGGYVNAKGEEVTFSGSSS